MYAIIKSGAKQYRVAENDVIDVELLSLDQGASVEFAEVLFVTDGSQPVFGEPFVTGYRVIGEVVDESAGPKVVGLKYVPRKRNKKKWGHRQHYTRVKIVEIAAEAKKKGK